MIKDKMALRRRERQNQAAKAYDLIIAGGGIYGAALLWEATKRGLSAILVEKGDFSGATSSNSLKIIHGGIRYLQQLDIKRMRESIKERKILMKIAPHLIHPLSCIMPTFGSGKNSRALLKTAFRINDLIAFDRNSLSAPDKIIPPGKIVSPKEYHEHVAGLLSYSDKVTGGAVWYDAQAYSSERLVISFIFSAIESGACALNYMKMKNLIVRKNKAVGVTAHDAILNKDVEIRGQVIVDCTGPWMNKTYKSLFGTRPNKQVRLAKAVNLVVPRKIIDYALGMRSGGSSYDKRTSGRLLFLTPWRKATLIGTWYFGSHTDPSINELSKDELDVCIREANSAFPKLRLTKSEISLIHLGYVPAEPNYLDGNRISPSKRYKIIDHSRSGGPAGMISVLGVKYTTARDVAEKTLAHVIKKLDKKPRFKSSVDRPLLGGDISNFKEYLEGAKEKYAAFYSPETSTHLITSFGTMHEQIHRYATKDRAFGELIPGSSEVIQAELAYILANEYVYSLSDLMLRRTDLGTYQQPENITIQFCADYLSQNLGWTKSEKYSEIDTFLSTYL